MSDAPSARSQWGVLLASGRIARWAAVEHAVVLRARLARQAVKSSREASVADCARQVADEWYAKAIDALRRQVGPGLDLSIVYPDAIGHLRESNETFYLLTMSTRLRIREEALRRIRTVTGPDWERDMMVSFWRFLLESLGRREA